MTMDVRTFIVAASVLHSEAFRSNRATIEAIMAGRSDVYTNADPRVVGQALSLLEALEEAGVKGAADTIQEIREYWGEEV